MHPAQIKAALTMEGFKQVALAREFGLAPGTVSAIINGRSRSKQVEERIAEITGHDLVELWPQWYGEGALELSDDERDLIKALRELPPAQRARVHASVHGGGQDSGSHVSADRGSLAAGRDVTVGHKRASSDRRKR